MVSRKVACPRSAPARAFTLLELTLVLALTAVLATITTLSLTAPLRAATSKDTLDRIVTLDRQTRALTHNTASPATLTFHSTHIERTHNGATTALPLPPQTRLGQIRIAHTDAQPTPTLQYAPTPPTYAIEILAPKSPPTWLLIPGLTGVPLETTDAQEIEAIFAH